MSIDEPFPPAHDPSGEESRTGPSPAEPDADTAPWQVDGGEAPPFQTPTPGDHVTRDELEADLDEEPAD